MKQKIIAIILLILCMIGISIYFFLKPYYNKKTLDWKDFTIQVPKETTLKEAAILWTYAYLDQYQEKHVWWNIALEKQSLINIDVYDEENKVVQVNTKLYPRYKHFFDKNHFGVMDELDQSVMYIWALQFETKEIEDQTLYAVKNKMPLVQLDLEEGNKSGRFEYEKQYYQDIEELKKQANQNKYFYKIENGEIYLTYDKGKNYKKAKLTTSLNLEKPYQLNDGMYQITKDFTLLADHNQLYYSNTQDGTFQQLKLPVEESILYVKFLTQETGYVFTMSGNALGGVIGIRILKTTDGGKTFENIEHNLETIHQSSEYNIINENIIFITDTKNGGNNGVLYRSEDGGKTFQEVDLPSGTFDESLLNTKPMFSFKEIYDTPMLPILENSKIYLIVGQGADGDYGNLEALYTSNDLGKTFTFVRETKPYEEG